MTKLLTNKDIKDIEFQIKRNPELIPFRLWQKVLNTIENLKKEISSKDSFYGPLHKDWNKLNKNHLRAENEAERVTVGSLEPCKTCPFKTGVEFEYEVNTMMINIEHCQHGGGHTCHQTDPLADSYVNSKGGVKACAGMLSMQKKERIWPEILSTIPTKEALSIWDRIPANEKTHSFKSFVKFAIKSILPS